MLKLVRRGLDTLYFIGGMIGALFMIAILALIVMQMVARWTGQVFPGATDYAGYCMAGASFFALAYALNHGAHLGRMGTWRRYAEIWCYGVAAVTATYFAYYAIKTNFGSARWNDISQGQDMTPLWIPQIAMSIGTVLLAIALWDHLVRILFSEHMGVIQPDITEGRD